MIKSAVNEELASSDEHMVFLAITIESFAVATKTDLHIPMLAGSSRTPSVVMHVRTEVLADFSLPRQFSRRLGGPASHVSLQSMRHSSTALNVPDNKALDGSSEDVFERLASERLRGSVRGPKID